MIRRKANDPALRAHAGAGPSFANALRESLASAIVFMSGQDGALMLSPEAGELLRAPGGRPLLTGHDLPPALLAMARQGLAGCAVRARQIEFSVAGRELCVNVTVVPLMEGKEGEGVLLVLNDCAREVELEQHLHQVNRLANAGTLAASMAHEIKNALVAGKTFVDLLLEKNRQDELADLVRRELGRVDAIVGRMLRLAGPGEARKAFEPVHLHEVLDYTLRLVSPELERRGIGLECSLEASPDLVNGEACQLQQAALNLLLNALEALGTGGKISLTTDLHDGGAVSGPSSQIRLTLGDTGPGIAPEHLARVFEPFFTTKSGGTGLGLAITRRIVSEHGGAIGVKSQPGQGTCFEILLPIAAFARP